MEIGKEEWEKERNKTYCQGNIIFNYILFDILAWIVQHSTTQRNATHKQKHFKAQTKLNQSKDYQIIWGSI